MTAAVDRWRAALAGAIAADDPEATARQVALRVLFMRSCEARGVCERGALRGLTRDRFNEWFARAAERWDCPGLMFAAEVDDAALRRIGAEADGLAAPPTEALGRCYERSLTGEARRAGGVVYTPEYVVEAIVARTIAGREGPPPRVLDPACGAGAFLLGAYRGLRRRGASIAGALRAVHGVDIDEQAIEVARLSLLLEAITDGARALPELAGTIRRGDALVGPGWRGRRWRSST